MTTTIGAQQFIVGAMTATGVIAAGEAIAEGSPPMARTFIGYAGACLGLGVVALWAPDLAASLAGLVLVATIFTKSDTLMSGIIQITGATPSPDLTATYES